MGVSFLLPRYILNRRPTGSRSNAYNRSQCEMKEANVGAAVKIGSDEQERTTILGTARVQANKVCAKRFKSGPRNQHCEPI